VLGVRREDGFHEITLDGGDRLIAGTAGSRREVAWSPDGRLLVTQESNPNRLAVHELTTGCRYDLIDDAGQEFLPTWVDDGRTIGFLRQPGRDFSTSNGLSTTVSVTGGEATTSAPSAVGTAWARDGTGRYATTSRAGITIRAPGLPDVDVSAKDGAEFPVWSPDGRHLVFSISVNPRVWVVEADGTGLRDLSSGGTGEAPRTVFFSSWSRDSTRLAYVAQTFKGTSAPAWYDLWVTAIDGTGRRVLTTSHTASPAWPQWSPSGTDVAYADSGSVNLVAADGTGTPHRVADGDWVAAWFVRR
jgi:Tol biopolymer transport system component